MRKNVASQVIGAQMVNASTGAAFTGSVTVYVTGDAGTQAVGSVGSGACTHEGNGYHSYAPAQAETNYDLIAFTFIGTGAIPATVQVFTIGHDPHGFAAYAGAYAGPRGPGVYLNDAAANTSTTNGVDGTIGNPVSTIAAAKTLADSMSLDRVYLVNNSDITLSATMIAFEFVGLGELSSNVVNLGGQDVGACSFFNLTLEGDGSSASSRIYAYDCALQDPGAGTTTFNIFAERCGIVDDISIDTSADNVFEGCYSLVAGTDKPIIRATGAAGTVSVRHNSGSIEFAGLSASHNVTFEGIGNVEFNANCNVNATVSLKGIGTVTDNTAGMANVDAAQFINLATINAQCDTALSDYDPPTRAELTVDIASVLTRLGTPAGADIAADLATIAGYIDTEIATLITNVAAVLADTGTTLDGKIDAIKAVTDALSVPTAAAIVAALLAGGDVDGFSVEETLKLLLAALTGKLSGAATSTNTLRAADDSKDRITATVDADGNRTAITLDAAG